MTQRKEQSASHACPLRKSDMVLFFPQYQAGAVPSRIPVGTPALHALWQNASGFREVPLQPTDSDDPGDDPAIRFHDILRVQQADAMACVEALQPEFILTTGGDCGASYIPIAYMNKLYTGKIGVIWVDAHADIHAPSTSPSGNYHGMVLRHLMGSDEFLGKPALPLTPAQIAYVGLRDTEQAEDDFIAAHHIPRFNALEVAKDNAPLEAIIAHFKANGLTHLHLHVDCDVLDQAVFPHVHVPEPEGLTLPRLIDILQYLRAAMPMASCCLTEYAPQKAGAGMDVVSAVYTEGLGLSLPVV